MFLRLQTQWVLSGMGDVVGLNYQSAKIMFDLYAVQDQVAMMEDLRDIEAGALDAMAKARERSRRANG